MKKSRLQLSLKKMRGFSCFLLLAVLAGCIQDDGPMRPPGNDGQNGLDGINYTHSVIYDIDPSDWIGNVDGYNTVIDIPEITDDIYYNGAVLVYRLNETEPKSFNLLPYTYVDNALSVYMDFDAYVGSMNLIYKEVFDGLNDTPAPDNIMSFKIVIIEGISLATLKTRVNINDYAAVSKLFNVDGVNSNIQ
jgi:hypothetical protein